MSETFAIDGHDVLAARDRIAGHVHRTPILTSRLVDHRFGGKLFFKCENFQRSGSFKIRGATNKLRSLTDDERARGVVAYSSGNHAQAVALAASELNVEAKIVMPSDAPRAKLAATRGYGATVIEYDRTKMSREAIGEEIASTEGRVLVRPYDDAHIMAGQGTAGIELLEDVPELDAIVTPVGGGGLLSGTATAVAALGRDVRVLGAEPAGADDWIRSLEQGERVRVEPDTIADGARTPMPGELTFPLVREKVEAIVRVPDEAIVRAMALMLSRMKIVVEPTGALAAAAALEGFLPGDLKRIGIVLSGGNVDLEMLVDLLEGVDS